MEGMCPRTSATRFPVVRCRSIVRRSWAPDPSGCATLSDRDFDDAEGGCRTGEVSVQGVRVPPFTRGPHRLHRSRWRNRPRSRHARAMNDDRIVAAWYQFFLDLWNFRTRLENSPRDVLEALWREHGGAPVAAEDRSVIVTSILLLVRGEFINLDRAFR